MHEMGIALEVAKLADEEAKRHGAARVTALSLKVGRWSGAEPETLRFALETLLADYPLLAGSRVEIETVEPTFACSLCAVPFEAQSYFDVCPACGGPGGALVAGDELTLSALDVEDA